MDEARLEHFKSLLVSERQKILANAAETMRTEMELSADDMPDESDLASAVYEQNMALRLRGRETRLLNKISTALRRINEGEFGDCEVCGDEIASKRLEARPVTTMCIACKEEQERRERSFV